MIVTAGPRQQRPLADVRAELDYSLRGVSACAGVVEDSSPSNTWHVLIEESPAGVPLAELAPLSERAAIGVLGEIARVAEAAHLRGLVLYGIHPRNCFAAADLRWSGMAPRSMRFLLGMPPMRGGLCLEEAYLPFEVWRDGTGTSASDVFSACALGLFLVTGSHPFAGPTFDGAIAATTRAPPERPDTPLGALLARGLAAADQRPTSAELRASLQAL